MANIVIKPWQEKILVMEIIIILYYRGKISVYENRIFILEIKLKLRFGGGADYEIETVSLLQRNEYKT